MNEYDIAEQAYKKGFEAGTQSLICELEYWRSMASSLRNVNTELEKEKILACIGYFIKDFSKSSTQEQYEFYLNLKAKLEKIL